jgi:hypothetical protein
MQIDEIITFVTNNIEPLPAYPPFGDRYRVAATMTDGTLLPCVVIEDRSRAVDLAIKRFKETQHLSDPYMGFRAIVATFVTKGNRVNDYDISKLAVSPFAIPVSRMREIGGEMSMSWTEFYARMNDGVEFRFGTTFLTDFFEMPDGYRGSDIVKINPAIRGEVPRQQRVYREKPFFTCYVDGL